MDLHTLGHACMLLVGPSGKPLLATDPWLTGSCYWRSWWMVNPPRRDQIRQVEAAPFIYVTHEHPDHLHLPSLRGLEKGERTILLPDFPRMGMDRHLRDLGFQVRVMSPRTWIPLDDGVSAMSIPLWNNDSILLLDTPFALIVNLNDAKPLGGVLADIADLRKALAKPCIVLRSHSPAGPFFNYFRDGERVPSLSRGGYVAAVQRACDTLGADLFLPFASQVVFRRSDTQWANAYRVGYEDLRAGWRSRTRLCPPFSTVDLATLAVRAEAVEEWRGYFLDRQRTLVEREENREKGGVLSREDMIRLRKVLSRQRWSIACVLPKGLAIESGGRRVVYNPWTGRLRDATDGGACTLRIPLSALRDGLSYGHFGDLCITMFVPIDLHGRTLADRVNLFWMLMVLADYGYAGSLWNRIRWGLWAWKTERRRPIAAPRP